MRFSLNWLREFVESPSDPEELARVLTMAGVEIEGIEERSANFENVVVAQIRESIQHPNADRLSVCVVDDGSGNPRQIVCGASNYRVGDKVPLALPGAELPGDLKIRASKLRGVESAGMLCSAKELRLSEDAAGLLILPPEAKIGAPINDLFPPDVIFDAEITPNRGDLLSHFGLAREIAALTGVSPDAQRSHLVESRAPGDVDQHRVSISARDECPFYSALLISKLKVAPSPWWLRARLESVGLRSINNVVDVSNYVMLELGQPTHAFDAAKVNGALAVRLARRGEELLALDGQTYALSPENLVIGDDAHVLGLAGVIGGEESGVSQSTTAVLLESAYFVPANIRRTARTLRLTTDASYRFERGVDPDVVPRASERVAELLAEIAGGASEAGMARAGELPGNPPSITLRYEKIDQLLGTHLERAESDEILTRFGLEPDGGPGLASTVWKIPSYRGDLRREVDLIEEIARGHGLDRIPAAERSRYTPLSAADHSYDWEMALRRNLNAIGFSEARSLSLIPRTAVASARDTIELRNPLSEDHVALRTSLLPGLLGAVAHNQRSGAPRIALFEIGDVFIADGQARMLALALTGRLEPDWRAGPGRSLDFFDLKGALETVADFEWGRAEKQDLVLGAELIFEGNHVGFAGQFSRAETIAASLEGAVYVAELRLRRIAEAAQRVPAFEPLDRYPAVTRDIAMFVGPEVMHAEVARVIALANEPLLERARLFDLFTENNGGGRKSMAYSLTYRAKNRTLTGDEVNAAHTRIREQLKEEIGAELRE